MRVDQLHDRISTLYPEVAYFMDPIIMIDISEHVDSDTPRQFKNFVFKYFKTAPDSGIQKYADKLYGYETKRPWESKYNFDQRLHHRQEHLNSCDCNANPDCTKFSAEPDFPISQEEHQAIIDREMAEFTTRYPQIAFCMDKINIVDVDKDSLSERPQTFKGFFIKFTTQQRFSIFDSYGDRIYGKGVRRPWESELHFKYKYYFFE